MSRRVEEDIKAGAAHRKTARTEGAQASKSDVDREATLVPLTDYEREIERGLPPPPQTQDDDDDNEEAAPPERFEQTAPPPPPERFEQTPARVKFFTPSTTTAASTTQMSQPPSQPQYGIPTMDGRLMLYGGEKFLARRGIPAAKRAPSAKAKEKAAKVLERKQVRANTKKETMDELYAKANPLGQQFYRSLADAIGEGGVALESQYNGSVSWINAHKEDIALATDDWKLIGAIMGVARARIEKLERALGIAQSMEAQRIDSRSQPSYYGRIGTQVFRPGTNIPKYGVTTKTASVDQMKARARDGFVGHGDYKDFFKGIAKHVGAAVRGGMKSAISSGFDPAQTLYGAAKGAWTGQGAYLNQRVLGNGDYQAGSLVPMNEPGMTQNNAIVNPGASNSRKPIQMSSGTDANGDLVVQYREFLTDIIPGTPDASGFYTVATIPVNPGLPGSFPLAAMLYGQYYSSYSMDQLLVEYVSTVGSSNTAVAGTVLMAPIENVNDPPYASKRGMERANGIVTCGIQQNLVMGIECAKASRLNNNYLIRTAAVNANFNLSTYDMCNYQIALSGVPSTLGAIGEVWVTYRIIFRGLRVFGVQPLAMFDGWQLAVRATTYNLFLMSAFGASFPVSMANTIPATQIDTLTTLAGLNAALGWNPSHSSFAPGLPNSVVDGLVASPQSVAANLQYTSGGNAVLQFQIEMLQGTQVLLQYVVGLMNATTGGISALTFPGLSVAIVSGAASLSGVTAAFNPVSVPAGGPYEASQVYTVSATGNGGLVTIQMTFSNTSDTNTLPWIQSSVISLMRVT